MAFMELLLSSLPPSRFQATCKEPTNIEAPHTYTGIPILFPLCRLVRFTIASTAMFQVLLASLWPSWWGLGSSLCAVSATAYGAVGLGLSWAQTEKLHPFLLEKYGIDLHKELGKFEDFEKLHGEWLNRLFDTLDEDADGLLDRDEVQNGICEYLELILKDVLLELGAGDESSMAHITFRERCQERILGQYSFDDDMEENERPSKIRHVLPQYQEDINKLTAWCFKKCDIDHDKRISRSE